MGDINVEAQLVSGELTDAVTPNNSPDAIPQKPSTKETDEDKNIIVVTSERQNEESRIVHQNILQRRMDEAQTKADRIASTGKDKTDKEEENSKSLTQGEAALVTMRWIAAEAPENADYTSDSELGKPFKGDSPITLIKDGEKLTVLGILKIKDSQLICMCAVQTDEPGKPTQASRQLTRQELNNAIFLSEGAAIVADMQNPAERRLFETILNPDSVTSEEKNKIIAEAATETGLISADALRAYITKKQSDTNISPEEREELNRISELINGAKAKNVIDRETMMQIVTQGLDKIPAELREQFTQSGENNPVQQYFDAIETGKIDKNEVQKLVEALTKGDKQAFLSSLIENVQHNQQLSETDKNAIVKKFEGFSAYSNGESLSLGLLMIMLSLGTEIGKAAISDLA